MAKKKKGEKAEPSFVFPEFNRTEWLEKEVRDSKAGLIGVAWALLVGLMSWQLSLATGQARYGLLFGFAACFAIIKILPLIIDTSSFERKSWAGPILTALFAWLGVFILLSNPPSATSPRRASAGSTSISRTTTAGTPPSPPTTTHRYSSSSTCATTVK